MVPDEAGFSPVLTAVQAGKIFGSIYKNWEQETFEGYLKRLDVPMDKPYGNLSLGMKKKLAMAIALSHGAKLLLLDEACSGLDPLAREQVREILFDFTRSEEHSVLISSHIVSELEKLCDYIAFMHKGKLVLFSEKDRLFESYGLLHCDEGTLTSLLQWRCWGSGLRNTALRHWYNGSWCQRGWKSQGYLWRISFCTW